MYSTQVDSTHLADKAGMALRDRDCHCFYPRVLSLLTIPREVLLSYFYADLCCVAAIKTSCSECYNF